MITRSDTDLFSFMDKINLGKDTDYHTYFYKNVACAYSRTQKERALIYIFMIRARDNQVVRCTPHFPY
jgi:hypothetical protein